MSIMESEEELSYGEILANLAMNEELVITIPLDKEEEVKTGLKNLKSRQNAKLIKENLPKPQETLEFSSAKSKEYEDCVDLRIILRKKGAVLVKKMVIPDNSFD